MLLGLLSSPFAISSSSARRRFSSMRRALLDRDRRLIGERGERRQLLAEADAGTEARLDVERADRLARGRSAADRHARDRLDHELVDAHGLREPRVVARARGDHGLALLDDALGDAAREVLRGLLALAVARGVRDHAALVVDEDDEPALGAEQADGVIGDALEEPVEVVLAREVARDLEDAREAVLGGQRRAHARDARDDRAVVMVGDCCSVSMPCERAVAGPCDDQGDDDERRHRRRVRLPQRPAARIVPEHLAQVARELRRRSPRASRARRRCRVARAPRALRAREARARVERAPCPLALTERASRARSASSSASRADVSSPRASASEPLTMHASGSCSRSPPSPSFARSASSSRESDGDVDVAGAPRRAEPREDALEPRLGGVERARDGLVRLGAQLVEARAALDVAHARRELGLEAEELRARVRRELVALLGEPLDRRARPRVAAEVEIEVREVEERLLDGDERRRRGAPCRARPRGARAPARGRRRPSRGPRGSAASSRASTRRAPSRPRERRLVGLARLLRAPAALVRDGERTERDRLDACVMHAFGDRHGLLERLERARLLAEIRERDAAHRERVGRERVAPARERRRRFLGELRRLREVARADVACARGR